ncbi:MAG TPA: PepSY domain-containing protein [Croceibacterium sp.]|nr:PepSY domain-containing protein [Croceibacterium sp.]
MRRILVQLHRWIGVALFLYVAMICLTGSVLVYRPELYRYFEPQPVEVSEGTRLLSDEALLRAAGRAFPDEKPLKVWRGSAANHAVEIDLVQGEERRNYLFDPYTGRPVGPTLPLGFRATTFLLQLHTELIGGESGRLANAALALGVVFLALSGVLVWRPRRSSQRGGGLRHWHMTAGIWGAVFLLMWGVTGFHLAYPALTEEVIEYFEPFDEVNPVERVGDRVSYWLAYLHFGRFGGVLPHCDRGESCAEALKAVWALIALIPAFLALSGFFLWLRGGRAKARVRRTR